MAVFSGNHKEFRRYIGPRLRNLVQQLTKKHKAQISACQHCAAKENLESAHVHGRDRNDIIELILSQESIDGFVSVDIQKFEERFVEEHQPLEKSILILSFRILLILVLKFVFINTPSPLLTGPITNKVYYNVLSGKNKRETFNF